MDKKSYDRFGENKITSMKNFYQHNKTLHNANIPKLTSIAENPYEKI